MLVDCDSCSARGAGCADCVVTVLLGPPSASAGPAQLDSAECAALEVLAGNGLVPPLRMAPTEKPPRRQAG